MRKDIQSLRGMAVMSVVLYHFAPIFFPNGYLGVDVFFVISGYVIGPKIEKIISSSKINSKFQKEIFWVNYKLFMIRRFWRLVPALTITLIISLITLALFSTPHDLSNALKQGFLSLFGLGNLGALLIVGDYFHPNPNPLLHTWSLSTEEQFYAILPLLLIFFLRNQKLQLKNLFVFLFFISLISYCVLDLKSDNKLFQDFAFYSPATRFWQFCLGYLAVRISCTKNGIRKYVSNSLLGALTITLFYWESLSRLIVSLISCFLVSILLITQFELRGRVEKILIWLGNRSYSIYLVHMPVAFIAVKSPLIPADKFKLSLAIGFLSTFILSILLFEIIEKPLRFNNLTKTQLRTSEVFKFVLIPAAFMLFGIFASQHNFFGLDKNPLFSDKSGLVTDCVQKNSKQPCDYRSNAIKNTEILLVGDSHAGSIINIFLEVSEKNSLIPFTWTTSGCQFINPEEIATKYGTLLNAWRNSGCLDANLRRAEYIKSHPKVIVVVKNRSTAFLRNGFDIDPLAYNSMILSGLSKYSNKIILLGPNPEFPDYDKFFAGKTLLWQQSYENIALKNFPLNSMLREPFLDDVFFESNKSKFSNIFYLNNIDQFCNFNSCTRWNGNQWLFKDGDHLSYYGSELLRHDLSKVIKMLAN